MISTKVYPRPIASLFQVEIKMSNLSKITAFGALLAITMVFMTLASCGREDPEPDPVEIGLERIFPTEEMQGQQYPNCIFNSPLWYETNEGGRILVARAAGIIEAVDPDTGLTDWSVELPSPEVGVKFVLATPAIVDDMLIVAYHAIPEDHGDYRGPTDRRLAHHVTVVDLIERQVHPSFPVIELAAEVEANEPGQTVAFRPQNALTRGTVIHGRLPGDDLGKIYLGQGNTRDVQPWHGWAWEIDLDQWRDQGAESGITAVLNTTPEPDENCGTHGQSGSRDRYCGGGLWAPTSHLLVEEEQGFHLILAPGNGQLDLNRSNYANTLMRVEPGLDFDPACDETACADFDPDFPSLACVESCQNLFVPRLMPDQQLQLSPDGRCDGMDSLYECWGVMDYIGGSTPVRVELENHNVLVYPTKDGHAYLVDADHMGRMYDRHRMVEMCGHNGGSCSKIWAGMAVTMPLITEIDGDAAVLIPTFMPDETNPAGLVALRVVERDGSPTLERAWEYPDFSTPEAIERFRNHSSLVALSTDGDHAWIVDVDPGGGRLTGVRIADGEPVFQHDLTGRGRRYALPLVHEDRVYVTSCRANDGPGFLEGYRLSPVDEP